jgi:hypothetical protein
MVCSEFGEMRRRAGQEHEHAEGCPYTFLPHSFILLGKVSTVANPQIPFKQAMVPWHETNKGVVPSPYVFVNSTS